MILLRSLKQTAAFVAALIFAPSLVMAGDNNVLSFKQQGNSNVLSIDQSAASNSKIGGVTLSQVPDISSNPNALGFGTKLQLSYSKAQNYSDAPIQQFGDHNMARIETAGSGASQIYLQQGSSARDISGSHATILVGSLDGGLNFAGVKQSGNNNNADVHLYGENLGGLIVQDGSSNTGSIVMGTSLSDTVDNAYAVLKQTGNQTGKIAVSSAGASGNKYEFTNGNNAPVSVVTTAVVTEQSPIVVEQQ